jgi:DNA-binding PadR family transcriptional regulator
LEREKLVTSRRTEVNGRSRIHYRLTSRGHKRLEKLSVEWNQVTAGISALMSDQHA